jgi:hypothetical protein
MITKKSKYRFQFQLSLLICFALVFSVLSILSLFTTKLSIPVDDYHTALAVRPVNVATSDCIRTAKNFKCEFISICGSSSYVDNVDNTCGGTAKTSDFTP